MKVHLIIDHDCVEVETVIIDFGIIRETEDYFFPCEEPKWVKFCKDHRFNPKEDYNTKIYKLYLEMCAEDML